MNIFLSAGEPSGDLHGARLVRKLQDMRHDVDCVGFGGPKMAEAGCALLHDMSPLALMFFLKVLGHLPTFFRLLRQADEYFRTHRVDAVVLIDYPGFNWCIARRAKRYGIPVFYYGAPQVWAWGTWRVRKLRRLVDYVLCQLPFEPAWYAERRCPACYVGHPFFEQDESEPLDEKFLATLDDQAKWIVLLPGSRRAEVESNAECFLQAAAIVRAHDPSIVIAAACFNEAQAERMREQAARMGVPVAIHVGRTRELISKAYACIACSGSVSLQLLMARVPTVIYFHIHRRFWLIKQLMIRSKYITLVNLFWTADIRRRSWRTFDPDAPGAEPVPMPEYLTTTPCPDKLAAHVIRWIADPAARWKVVAALDQVARQTATPGATRRAAEFIFRMLDSETGLRRAA